MEKRLSVSNFAEPSALLGVLSVTPRALPCTANLELIGSE